MRFAIGHWSLPLAVAVCCGCTAAETISQSPPAAEDTGAALDAGVDSFEGGQGDPDTGLPGQADATQTSQPDASIDAGGLGDTGVDAPADTGGVSDAGDFTPEPEREPPTFEHLDDLVDAFRGSVPVWVSFARVSGAADAPAFQWFEYADTGTRADFWPASTIKIYAVTAALELLAQSGFSLDAQASFYRRANGGDDWIHDTTRTFRQMIFDVFDYSSNIDYTLLLRFAGVDWINTEFFTADNGFRETALMRGYVSDRPGLYRLSEEQRIVVEEDGASIERIHSWSGRSYANDVGCTVYNDSGTGNCSTPEDMVEHMRRVMFHEWLPADQQFDVRLADLDWVRYGGEEPVLNDWESTWADGIFRVMPDANYYHKAGLVSEYALDLHYVDDQAGDTRYIAAIVTQSATTSTYQKLSEEIARMAMTPYAYVHLDFLQDYVNPVAADLMVYSAEPGVLALIVKDYEADPNQSEGWTVLAGTETPVTAGTSWYAVQSLCLSADGRYHVRGRFTPDADDLPVAYSDLHYVIVDADVACP